MTKADLHIHSLFSPDAIARPESILRAAAESGIGMIAITDHDTTAAWRHFAALERRYPVEVIYGQEVRLFRNSRTVGELLCLFLEQPVRGHSVGEVLDQVRAQDGLVSIAHPFSERRIEFLAYNEIDCWDGLAIEVRNGRCYNRRDNEMAENLARRLGTVVTAGSDAHTPYEVGSAYVEFSGSRPIDLKRALLSGDAAVGGGTSSLIYSLMSGFGRLGVAV